MSLFDPLLGRLRPDERRGVTSPFVTAQLARTVHHDWTSGPRPEAFRRNPIVYRCVRMIAEAAASIGLQVEEHGVLSDTHPILSLLRRPNMRHSGVDWLDMLVSHLLLFGNAYIEAVGQNDAADLPDGLSLSPDRCGLFATNSVNRAISTISKARAKCVMMRMATRNALSFDAWRFGRYA